MKITSLVLFFSILLGLSTHGHAQAATSSPQDSATGPNKKSEPFTSDTPDILRETQLAIRHPGYAGLVWWIPFEFWQKSAMDRGISADKGCAVLRKAEGLYRGQRVRRQGELFGGI